MAADEKDRSTENKNSISESKIEAGKNVHIGDIITHRYEQSTKDSFGTTLRKNKIIFFLLLMLISYIISSLFTITPVEKLEIPLESPKNETVDVDEKTSTRKSELYRTNTKKATTSPIKKAKESKIPSENIPKEVIDKSLVMPEEKPKAKVEDIYSGTFKFPGNENISSFRMSKYEVTVGQYLAYCENVNNNVQFPYTEVDTSQLNLPMSQVSWNEASDYCRSIGGRLPRLAEWKATVSLLLTDTIMDDYTKSQISWNKRNSQGNLHPVGQKGIGKNQMKVYDLFGNVDEWLLDGPKNVGKYTIGGHYNSSPARIDLKTAPRQGSPAKSPVVGFRVVYDK